MNYNPNRARFHNEQVEILCKEIDHWIPEYQPYIVCNDSIINKQDGDVASRISKMLGIEAKTESTDIKRSGQFFISYSGGQKDYDNHKLKHIFLYVFIYHNGQRKYVFEEEIFNECRKRFEEANNSKIDGRNMDRGPSNDDGIYSSLEEFNVMDENECFQKIRELISQFP